MPEPLALSDSLIERMQTRFAEDVRVAFEHAQTLRAGWRPDPNNPGVEIKVTNDPARGETEIRARYQPRTGETDRESRSVVRDEYLRVADDPDRFINDHIRLTVEHLTEERRRAEHERQAAARRQFVTANAYPANPNYYYNNAFTVAATTTITYDWHAYANVATTFNADAYGFQYAYTPPVQTPEQQAAAVERQRAWQAEHDATEKTAEELLLDVIGHHRYRIWRRKGVVHVSSRKYRNLRYEIKAGEMIKLQERQGNKWRLRKDRLCVHPRDKHPRGDEVATLFVLARFDEEALWKTANHHYRDQEPALELAA